MYDFQEKKQIDSETKLLGHLKALGNSSYAVAKKLGSMKIRGGVNSTECPITMYLKRLRYQNVSVSTSSVDCETRSGVGIDLSLPKACLKFVVDFDNGLYPGLLKKNAFVLE